MEETKYIKIRKMDYGEYPDTWHLYYNEDQDTVDEEIGLVKDEVVKARGSTDSLLERLENVVTPAGAAIPSDELTQARDPHASLSEALAVRSNGWVPNALNYAPSAEDTGIHSFVSGNGVVVTVEDDGDILFDIGGYVQVINSSMPTDDKSITLPTSPDNYYIYVEKGTSEFPILGYSTSYGANEDGVYFSRVTVGDTNVITTIKNYRIRREYNSGWQNIATEETTGDIATYYEFTHNLGQQPIDIQMFVTQNGRDSDPHYQIAYPRVIVKLEETTAEIAINPNATYLFHTVSAGVTTEHTSGYIKIIIKA